MPDHNVILVAEFGQRRERYLQELAHFDLAVDCVEQPGDVFQRCTSEEYSGLLFDFATMMKSQGVNKQQLEELSARFPTLRLHVDPARDTVVGLLLGQKVTGDNALESFVEKCRAFRPVSIRTSKRIDRILNVVVFGDNPPGSGEGFRANTTNISLGGAFITTLHPFDKKEIIEIEINEFPVTTPIACQVHWIQPWGVENRLPGVGVSFKNISEEHRKKFEHYVSIHEKISHIGVTQQRTHRRRRSWGQYSQDHDA